MIRFHRRLLGLAVAAGALAPLTACGTGGPAGVVPNTPPDPATRPALRAFYQQHLDWQPCGPLWCAKLTVPMDYTQPENGKTFVLPVVKEDTTQPATRIGSLVLNPGGPGGSGVELLKSDPDKVVSADARAHFDVVSFDPRGVAGSKPALDCTPPDGSDAQPDGPAAAPDSGEERAAAVADAQRTLAACRAHSGEILPHVGTPDAARDLDVLRAALGDQKLTYLGWSYGTSLGTTYGELFPARVRALVLDGAVDPSQDWAQRAIRQSIGFERALTDYTEKCAATVGDACPAGGNPAAIATFVGDLFDRVRRHPLKIAGSTDTVDINTLQNAVVHSMYSPEAQWKDLSDALRAAGNGNGAKIAAIGAAESPAPDPGTDPGADGPDGAPPAPNNESAALTAVNCLDIPHPHDLQPYWDLLDQAKATAGVFGTSFVYSELGCRDWPAGEERPHRVHAPGVPPVLVVGTTGDPATPYEDAQSLAAQFPGGMLLTYRGTGHTAYGRSNVCVSAAVDGYLIDGKPVSAGTTC